MNKKIIYIVVVLAIIISGFFTLNNYIYNAKQTDDSRIDGEVGAFGDFDKTGRVVFDTPGLKPGVYYLLYEEPGKPAITAELIFDADSACVMSGKVGKCPETILVASSLTRVQGILEGGRVRVISAIAGE